MFRVCTLIVCMVIALPAFARAEKPSVAALQLAILSAPGVIGCNFGSPHPLEEACAHRAMGVEAFDELRKIDPQAARIAVLVRFREIPSEQGGYFPILLAARSMDRAYLDALDHVVESQAETVLADYARVTAQKIRAGKCTDGERADDRYAEICD